MVALYPQSSATPLPSKIDSAFDLISRGYSIFPCHWPDSNGKCSCGKDDCISPGKHPHTEHGCKDASNNLKTIRKWWNRCPDANIGIATGKMPDGRYLIMVDVDIDKGAEFVDLGDIPETRTAKRGPNLHLYFTSDVKLVVCQPKIDQ